VSNENPSTDPAGDLAAQPLEEAPQEALRLIHAGASLPIPLRLIGGTAVWLRCPTARMPPLARPYGDIDLVSVAKNNTLLTRFFASQGYEADKLFNALHGAQRLNFTDPLRERPLDVLLDRFVMCHTLELRDRLVLDDITIPISDLLLTKAQVIRLNEKDIKDIVALLADYEIGTDGIDLDRLTEVTRSDWGLEHTIRKTLAEVQESLAGMGLNNDALETIGSRIASIVAALDAGPKTARWRMRARIGERVRWYEEPEEARR
jgi:hypothetical protein